MFVAGDRVLYGSHGVCCVTALEQRKIDRDVHTYLVLEPEGKSGSSYLVPTHNAAAMAKLRRVLTGPELDVLLHSPQLRQGEWIDDSSRRKQVCRETFGSGDRLRILQMIAMLYRHREERFAQGKKIHQSDDGFLRDGEKLICSEICWVMQMDFPQAKAYLQECLK